MRVSCIFVTVAVMLAEQSNALPILGLGSEGHLVNTLTNTLDRVPVTGGLTSDLLESEDKTRPHETSHELLNTDGALDQVTGSLLRRQGLPLVNTVGSVLNGVQTLPVLGSVGSILPVSKGLTSNIGSVGGDLPVTGSLLRRQELPLVNTLGSVLNGVETPPALGSVGSIAPVSKGLTSNIGSVNGALPDVKKVASATTHVLPAHAQIPSIAPVTKGLSSEIGAVDVGHLPVAGSLLRRQGIPLVRTLGSVLNGVESLPTLGSVGSIAPVTKGLTSEISAAGHAGSLLRRDGPPLVNTLGSVLNGAETLPVLGSVGSIAPVSKGLTSNIGPVNAALPDVKEAAFTTTRDSALLSKIHLFTKRDGSIPVIGTVPVVSSIPVLREIGSLPGLNAIPTFDSLPGYEKIQVLNSVPGFTSIENIADVVPESGLTRRSGMDSPEAEGLTKRGSGIPFIGSLPLVGQLPGVTNLPGISSVPGVAHLPSVQSLYPLGTLPFTDDASGLSGVKSLTSTLPIPSIF